MLLVGVMCILQCFIVCIHTFRTLADVVKSLTTNLSLETYDMVIRRGHVLEDALKRAGRALFNASKRIKVSTVVSLYVCYQN